MDSTNKSPGGDHSLFKMDFFKTRVREGAYTLFTKENMRSDVWQSFKGIMDQLGTEVFGVACCSKCQTCIRFKGLKNGIVKDFGTKNLRDHLLFCGTFRKKRRRKSKDGFSDNNIVMIPDLNQKIVTSGDPECKIELTEEYFLQQINTQLSQNSHAPPCKDEDGSNKPVCMSSNPNNKFVVSIDHVKFGTNEPNRHSLISNNNTEGSTKSDPNSKNTSFCTTKHPSSKRGSGGDVIETRKEAETKSKLDKANYSITRPQVGAQVGLPLEDEHDIFGRHVAYELRSLPNDAGRRWARLQIQKTLFDAHSYHPQDSMPLPG